jgi:hypothetical protein
MNNYIRKLMAAFTVLLTLVPLLPAQQQSQRTVRILSKPGRPCGSRTVALLVDPALRESIRNGLDRFKRDLCITSYDTVEHSAGFADPAALRQYLQGIRKSTGGRLVGAILIGNMPHAYQWVTFTPTNPAFPPTAEEVVSFQYYADLDGAFNKSATYSSPGRHKYSYDLHSGNVNWEIWLGVLPIYKGDLQRTATDINRYFAKNHAYRNGRLTRPNVFLQVNEHAIANTIADHNIQMAAMRSGAYSWTPFSNSLGARLYFNSPPAGLSVQQGYEDLQAGLADFTVTDSHGSPAASGQLTISTVESKPVRTLFFWSNGCAIGNLDHPDNFLTSVLYSPTSEVVVAKGTTNDSGGMGNNLYGFFGHNIASALEAGTSFGEGVLSHVNVPLISPWSGAREFHFATAVILGDPTLLRLSSSGPDLIPVGRPELPGPAGFCKTVKTGQHKGKLNVTITNRGNVAAAASSSLVQFSSGRWFLLPTPTIPPGGSVDLPLSIPAACFKPDCTFKITVDSKGQVKESNEVNNTVVGDCLG